MLARGGEALMFISLSDLVSFNLPTMDTEEEGFQTKRQFQEYIVGFKSSVIFL